MSYVMLAAYDSGSVAVMPIAGEITDQFMAQRIVLDWLSAFDHGFDQAVVSPCADLWENAPTKTVWDYVMTLAPVENHLL